MAISFVNLLVNRSQQAGVKKIEGRPRWTVLIIMSLKQGDLKSIDKNNYQVN